MKVVIEIMNVDKATVLDSCLMSAEAKQSGSNVLLWYYAKSYWKEDKTSLEKALKREIQYNTLSWNDNRFVYVKN